jgi:hypothetical protein
LPPKLKVTRPNTLYTTSTHISAILKNGAIKKQRITAAAHQFTYALMMHANLTGAKQIYKCAPGAKKKTDGPTNMKCFSL